MAKPSHQTKHIVCHNGDFEVDPDSRKVPMSLWYQLSRVRIIYGTNFRGDESSWVRIVLGATRSGANLVQPNVNTEVGVRGSRNGGG